VSYVNATQPVCPVKFGEPGHPAGNIRPISIAPLNVAASGSHQQDCNCGEAWGPPPADNEPGMRCLLRWR